MIGMLSSSNRTTKKVIAVTYDSIAICLSLYAAICLRLSTVQIDLRPIDWFALSTAPLIALYIFSVFGLYRTVIRYATFRAFIYIFLGLCASTFVLIASSFFVNTFVPRSVPIIFLFISLVVLSLPRLAIRNIVHIFKPSNRMPVLIYGSGENAIDLARALNNDRTYYPAAFVDNDPAEVGNSYNGLPVFSEIEAGEFITQRNIRRVFIATQNESKQERVRIVRTLEKYPVRVQTIPALQKLISGESDISDVHDIDITDLLGRDPVAPDLQLMQEHIQDKNILVTGAGGSIGSELCRQIIKYNPKSLVLFECSEYNLYKILEELTAFRNSEVSLKNVEIKPLLGNIQNRKHIENSIKKHNVNVIYHAAAFKHVPLVEDNAFEGITNNLFGTINCVQAAIAAKVSTFVLVSTDKAVRPTNIMGASKRLAEMVLQALSKTQNTTTLCMVRFGNVLNSSGSVVPKFREQIRRRKPITITHPEITRYFMTTTEAAQLVIQAGALATGGDVFVLEMGEPIKILDLAKEMILLSGLTVKDKENSFGDIEIVYTGLRPGEKLFEELLIGSENCNPTINPRIQRAEEFYLAWEELETLIDKLEEVCVKGDYQTLQNTLMTCPIAYGPIPPIAGEQRKSKKAATLKLISS